MTKKSTQTPFPMESEIHPNTYLAGLPNWQAPRTFGIFQAAGIPKLESKIVDIVARRDKAASDRDLNDGRALSEELRFVNPQDFVGQERIRRKLAALDLDAYDRAVLELREIRKEAAELAGTVIDSAVAKLRAEFEADLLAQEERYVRNGIELSETHTDHGTGREITNWALHADPALKQVHRQLWDLVNAAKPGFHDESSTLCPVDWLRSIAEEK